MEQDVTIKQILYDVGNGSERKNIALRLWADCLDAAKTLRKMYNVGKNPNGSDIQKEYTQYDREHAFKETDPMSERDPIYAAGVESAPFHELLLEKIGQTEIYLDGVPPNSKV